MAKPGTLPRWAETAGGTQAPNIVAPGSGKQDIGYTPGGDTPTSGGLNWLFRWFYKWCQYLDGLAGEALTWTAKHTFSAGLASSVAPSGANDVARKTEVDGEAAARAAADTAEATARAVGDAATLESANAGMFLCAGQVSNTGALVSHKGSLTPGTISKVGVTRHVDIPGLTAAGVVVVSSDTDATGVLVAGSGAPRQTTSTTVPSVVLDARASNLRRALKLEYLTVGWNLVEGGVGIAAALLSGSIALLGFGVDSFVECASGLVLIWRLAAERRGMDEEAIERIDERAHKPVGASLFLLAAYIAVDAILAFWRGGRPDPSMVGVALTAVSLVAMVWLARAKRRAAAALGSRALQADAFQTTACFWLSAITLVGIGLNALVGWWWADPMAALGMTWFIGREGLEAWRGEECGCVGAVESAEHDGGGDSCGCPSSAQRR